MSELKGQLALFTLDGCDQKIQDEHADEVCSNCDGLCPTGEDCLGSADVYGDEEQT